jgi:hypothetical protein
MEQKELQVDDSLRMKDEIHEKHGLRGVVTIHRKNKETGEVSFWDSSENIIPISGVNFLLMKAFGLYLDSSHGKATDNRTRDVNLATPDLNERLEIGVEPDRYTVMEDDIAVNHICQGFMIGNGGAGEDSITAKNTSYSFISLRNPIPFQQFQGSLNPTIAGKYLGLYHGTQNTSDVQSAYIKKFDTRPHIYHSWWVDGQRWDYVDPVTENYLGPSPQTTSNWKTDRIESYVECKLSLSDTDCLQYFNQTGSNSTAMVNELGLVAFDTIPGQRSVLETLHELSITPYLELIYKRNRTEEDIVQLLGYGDYLANDIFVEEGPGTPLRQNTRLDHFITSFMSSYTDITNAWGDYQDDTSEHYQDLEYINGVIDDAMNIFSSDENIHVTAYYNQNNTLMYIEDDYMNLLQSVEMSDLGLDQAQRIKLITYYTFNSIPLSENWEILINYRIYAN